MSHGRYQYIPPVVVDELEEIKQTDNINCDADAFKLMAKNSKIGRNAVKEIIGQLRGRH